MFTGTIGYDEREKVFGTTLKFNLVFKGKCIDSVVIFHKVFSPIVYFFFIAVINFMFFIRLFKFSL